MKTFASALCLLVLAFLYVSAGDSVALLLIPPAFLASIRLNPESERLLAPSFLLSFAIACLLLVTGDPLSGTFGALSYVLFATMAVLSAGDYIAGR
jgi:hypothetical protein